MGVADGFTYSPELLRTVHHEINVHINCLVTSGVVDGRSLFFGVKYAGDPAFVYFERFFSLFFINESKGAPADADQIIVFQFLAVDFFVVNIGAVGAVKILYEVFIAAFFIGR